MHEKTQPLIVEKTNLLLRFGLFFNDGETLINSILLTLSLYERSIVELSSKGVRRIDLDILFYQYLIQ